jgi:predicted TIM-barrel fold metal-dependent hydrolase
LIHIISESFDDTWDYLVDNEQDKLAIMVVRGSFIEGIYITSQIALTAADNSNFLEIIAHQKKSLNTLIGIIEPVKDDADLANIYQRLSELATIYEGVGDTLTEEQLGEIQKIIDPLRESIV